MVDENSNQELQGWGDVLEDTHQGEGDALGGGREHDQRRRRHQPGAYQERIGGGPEVEKGPLAGLFHIDQVQQGRHQQEAGFQGEPADGSQRGNLLDQPIEPKSEGQRQRNPGQRPIDQGQIKYPGQGQYHGNPLPEAQAFTQKDDPQKHADQGINEVAQAGLDDEPGVDGPHIGQPVDPDQQRRSGVDQKHPRGSCSSAERCVLT